MSYILLWLPLYTQTFWSKSSPSLIGLPWSCFLLGPLLPYFPWAAGPSQTCLEQPDGTRPSSHWGGLGLQD